MSGVIKKREKVERIIPSIELAMLDDVSRRLRELRDILKAPLSVGSIGFAAQNIAKDNKGEVWIFEEGKAVPRTVYALEAIAIFDSVRVVELRDPPRVQLQKIGITINAATVTLGVDIRAQTVSQLNMNIAASAINVPIDIAAQTIGNINVNLAASAITLNVNIASQAANVNIDIKAQSISVKLVPDWGAINATDVDVAAEAQITGPGSATVLTYTVPTGKTLLIYDWSGMNNTGDEDISAFLYWVPLGAFLGVAGGAKGFQTPFSKPKRVAAGKTVCIDIGFAPAVTRYVWAHLGGTLL